MNREPQPSLQRVGKKLAALTIRATSVFIAMVAIQWGTVSLGWFGDQPVIPVAFFACVNVFMALVVLPLLGLSGFAAIRSRSFRLLWLLSVALGSSAIYFGFYLVGSVFFNHG